MPIGDESESSTVSSVTTTQPVASIVTATSQPAATHVRQILSPAASLTGNPLPPPLPSPLRSDAATAPAEELSAEQILSCHIGYILGAHAAAESGDRTDALHRAFVCLSTIFSVSSVSQDYLSGLMCGVFIACKFMQETLSAPGTERVTLSQLFSTYLRPVQHSDPQHDEQIKYAQASLEAMTTFMSPTIGTREITMNRAFLKGFLVNASVFSETEKALQKADLFLSDPTKRSYAYMTGLVKSIYIATCFVMEKRGSRPWLFKDVASISISQERMDLDQYTRGVIQGSQIASPIPMVQLDGTFPSRAMLQPQPQANVSRPSSVVCTTSTASSVSTPPPKPMVAIQPPKPLSLIVPPPPLSPPPLPRPAAQAVFPPKNSSPAANAAPVASGEIPLETYSTSFGTMKVKKTQEGVFRECIFTPIKVRATSRRPPSSDGSSNKKRSFGNKRVHKMVFFTDDRTGLTYFVYFSTNNKWYAAFQVTSDWETNGIWSNKFNNVFDGYSIRENPPRYTGIIQIKPIGDSNKDPLSNAALIALVTEFYNQDSPLISMKFHGKLQEESDEVSSDKLVEQFLTSLNYYHDLPEERRFVQRFCGSPPGYKMGTKRFYGETDGETPSVPSQSDADVEMKPASQLPLSPLSVSNLYAKDKPPTPPSNSDGSCDIDFPHEGEPPRKRPCPGEKT